MSIRKKLAEKKTKLLAPKERLEDHPVRLHDYKDGDFYNVDIDMIMPNPSQPRKYFDPTALDELTQSIKRKGVLQPVIIRQGDDNKFYLVAGERRFRAAKKAGLEKIPSVFTTGNSTEIALIENLQREDLNPIDEAEALKQMMDEYTYTQEQIARIIGKARSTITESLSLNKLPEQIKKECRRADTYPRRLLVEIAKQKTSEDMLSLFDQIKKNNLKSSAVREITRKPSDSIKRTHAEILLNKTAGLIDSLSKLKMDTFKGKEKALLIAELHKLKKAIEEIIT